MSTEKNKLIELLKNNLINNPIESNAPTYQPIYFQDFKDLKVSLNKEKFYKKSSLIFEYFDTDLSGKKFLDIGSNAGYFSFAVAERNALVDALEISTSYYELCLKLCQIYGESNINFINEGISKELLKGKHYNYGFMLSVFQWISEGNEKIEYAKGILMETSKHVDTLFFELGCNSGKSAITTQKINHLAFIYNLLKNNTIYGNIKLIGTTKLWGDTRYLFICSNRKIVTKEPMIAVLKTINI